MAKTNLTAEQIVDILAEDFIFYAKGGLDKKKAEVIHEYLSDLLAHRILNAEGIQQVRERYINEKYGDK